MREPLLMPSALGDIGWWVQHDIKILKKIYQLLENTCRNPFDGIGQPEPLKANYSGYWSRRITKEHRMVYKVEENKIIVHSLHGHYSD
jgi:toxin YoeB